MTATTSSTQEPQVNWSQDQMVEVLLNEPDFILKETFHKNQLKNL